MKFPLAATLLLTSAHASVWPYHGAIDIASSAGRGFVGAAYSGVPVISFLSMAFARRAPSMVLGLTLDSIVTKEAFTDQATIATAKTNAKAASEVVTATAPLPETIVMKEPLQYTLSPSQKPVAIRGLSRAATLLGPSAEAKAETAVISAIPGNATNGTGSAAVPAEKVSVPKAEIARSARTGAATETAAMRLSGRTVIIAGPKPGLVKVVSNGGASSSTLVGAPTPGQITIFGSSGAPVLIRGASEGETLIEGSKFSPISTKQI
ncbi:hypothetical protein KM043_013104 [Ampulex compressa]|nr:hypothetical protein KM043_013104 [Ampulex compressa]